MNVTNLIIEKNMTRYNLVYGEYVSTYSGRIKCFFIWNKYSDIAGPSFTWQKGDVISANYLTDKFSKGELGMADAVSILSALKEKFPDSIAKVIGMGEYQFYQ